MTHDDTVVSPAEVRDLVLHTVKRCPLWALTGQSDSIPYLEIQGTPVVGDWPDGDRSIVYTEAIGCYVVAPWLSRVVFAGPAVCTPASSTALCLNGTGTTIAYVNVGVLVNTFQDLCCLVAWCRQTPKAPGFWAPLCPPVSGWRDLDLGRTLPLLRTMHLPPSAFWILPSPWRTRHAFKWQECPCETCQTCEVLRTMLDTPLAYERFQARWAEVVEYGRHLGFEVSYTTAVEKCTDPRCPIATHTMFVIQVTSQGRVLFIRRAQGKGSAIDALEWVHARLAACTPASLAALENGVGACQPAE